VNLEDSTILRVGEEGANTIVLSLFYIGLD
jgi:hypothetical protein